MSHSYHEALPGFDPKQILHDGCEECETRGENIERALSYLDEETFERAWQRAYDWNGSGGNLAISYAEKPLLRALWGVQVHLERRGVPLGRVPESRDSELAKTRAALAETERQRDQAREIASDFARALDGFPFDRAMRAVSVANRYVAAWRRRS